MCVHKFVRYCDVIMDTFDETISPGQTEKVQQFQEITGIDDLNRCRDILIRNGWDLEVAMQEVSELFYF